VPSTEKCATLMALKKIDYEKIFTLDCQLNTLFFPTLSLRIALNETQKRLLLCLLNGINIKREIIALVWQENHQRINDNNYHQLVFQMRALFQRNGLPGELIITIPNYGLKLNEQLLHSLVECSAENEAYNDEKASSTKQGALLPRLLAFARSIF